MHNIVHKNITHKGYNPSLIIIMRTSRGSLSLIQVQRHNTHLLPFHPPTPSPGLPPPPNAATNIPTGPTIVAPIKYSDLIFTSKPISSVAGDHVPFSEISFKVGEWDKKGTPSVRIIVVESPFHVVCLCLILHQYQRVY